jgi:hypothetical protein
MSLKIGIGEQVVHTVVWDFHGEIGLNSPPVVRAENQEHEQESRIVPTNL